MVNYGRTRSGKPITDELLEKLSAEAEEGFDVEEILRRRGGRPPMGSAAASVESVRLDPELSKSLRQRADEEGRTSSELIRDALRRYLGRRGQPDGPPPTGRNLRSWGSGPSGGLMPSERTGKKAASNAGKTLGATKATKASKSASGSALSQTKSSGVTGTKAASSAGSTLGAKKSTKAAKSAAGSALTQKPAKKTGKR